MKSKFNSFEDNGNERIYEYGDVFQVETTTGPSRLKIGPRGGHIDLIVQLADNLPPPFFVLYVLVTAGQEHKLGRYQSPAIQTKEELQGFLKLFEEYFESDGRHHVWVGTLEGKGTIVYDQHNVILAYGPITIWEDVLIKNGFARESFNFPSPHAHLFHKENNGDLDGLLSYWDWRFSELMDVDTYD